MKKVVCTHLFNDFSGSPLVLSTVINGFIERGIAVDLMTSEKTEGFLSNLEVNYVDNNYEFVENKAVRIFKFFFTQFYCFIKMLRYRNEEVVVYVNTLLPFGVAIAGKLMNKKVVFHVHETSVKPPFLKSFLKWVCKKTASEIIYVSQFLQKQEPIGDVSSSVVYNALSTKFVEQSQQSETVKKDNFIVLMLCSLKGYKGVNEFISLASHLPEINFQLVLNAEQEDIDEFFYETSITENVELFSKQRNVHPFYKSASLVVNMSHPKQWVETFGMTLLEGMQYGLPAFGPPVGGCTEFVENDVNGYQIDQRNLTQFIVRINELSTNKALYQKLSENAEKTASQFRVENMCDRIADVVLSTTKITNATIVYQNKFPS